MKKYAVIKIKGNQYKVTEGEEILVSKLNEKKLDTEVLLISDGKKVKIGKPTVKNARVGLKIIEEEVKGKKLYVRKFKAKSRYRKKVGFRPVYTKLQVVKVS